MRRVRLLLLTILFIFILGMMVSAENLESIGVVDFLK